jgi:uncharacterized BrkB/YihY/UPF0761 family membrane protein
MNHSFFGVLSFIAVFVFILFLYIFSNSVSNSNNNLGNQLNFQQSIDNGTIYYNMIFLVVLFVCGFFAWIYGTTIDNWFKKYFFNNT